MRFNSGNIDWFVNYFLDALEVKTVTFLFTQTMEIFLSTLLGIFIKTLV